MQIDLAEETTAVSSDELYDFQESAVEKASASLACRINTLLVSPTGSGKTCMGSEIVRRAAVQTLWLTHRRELVWQAAQRLRRIGLQVGVVLAGEEEDSDALVQVASVQTIANREKRPQGLIVIDEAHHASADQFKFLCEHYADVPRLGLTATPFRLDGRGLGEFFQLLTVAACTDELCERGVLIEPTVFVPARPDLSLVKKTAGDFNIAALADAMDTPALIGDIVASWRKHGDGRRTVCFAVNVAHSQHIVSRFQESGVPAEHIDGSTPTEQRAAALARLASGETLVLSNCSIITEGFDLPVLDAAIVARPTTSLCLHLQILGRVMRRAPGKTDAIVLDHAGNHLRLGTALQHLEYSLEGKVKRMGEGGARESTARICPKCDALLPAGARVCPECGHRFSDLPEERAGELVQLSAAAAESEFRRRCKRWSELEQMRIGSGYKPGWSSMRFKEAFGDWPVIANGALVNTSKATHEQKRAVYEDLRKKQEARGFAVDWISHRYRDIFGVWPKGVRS